MDFNFSTRLSGLSGSATREIFKLLVRPEIISFAGGLPASECLAVDDIARVSNAILTDCKNSKNLKTVQYGTTEGNSELVEQVCNLVKDVGITDITHENCLIVSGGQQGIDLVFKTFLDKGDCVLVENPTYLAVLQMIKSYEVEAVGVNALDDGLNLEDLERKIKEKKPKILYTVPTFSNPTGKTYSDKNRKQIAELCARHNVIIIEDDPYGRLRFSGSSINALKCHDKTGNVVYISSFSKTLSPGLRVGYAIGDKKIIRKMTILKQGQDLHTSNLSQAITLEFLKSGLFLKNIQKNLPIYRDKKDAMINALKQHMPKNFKFTNPDGGLFIWGEFKSNINTVEKFKEAVDKNVAYIQGQVFYADQKSGLNTLRLNYSLESIERIKKGIEILAKVFM